MKRMFFRFVSLLARIAPMAKQKYYIPSGENPRSYSGVLHIVIKSNSGELWYAVDESSAAHLHKDINYYKKAFRAGKYLRTGGNIYSPLNGNLISSKPYAIHHDCIEYHDLTFYRLRKEQTLRKCRIFKYKNFGEVVSTRLAFSLDYSTFIADFDKDRPRYYKNVPLENLVRPRNPIRETATEEECR